MARRYAEYESGGDERIAPANQAEQRPQLVPKGIRDVDEILGSQEGGPHLIGVRHNAGSTSRDVPQLGGADPADFWCPSAEQRPDDAVALVQGRAPVGEERVPVERVLGTDEFQRRERDALTGESCRG